MENTNDSNFHTEIESYQTTPIQTPAPSSGVKNNKGKFIVLIFYCAAVFLGSLTFLTPFAQTFMSDTLKSLAPKDVDVQMRQYIQSLKQADYIEAFSLMREDLHQNVSTSSLEEISANLASTTVQMEIVGGSYNSRTSGGNTTTNYDVVYEIQNSDSVNKYVLAEIQAQDTGNGLVISGFHVLNKTQSVKEEGKFNIKEQGLYLLLSILVPLFVAYVGLRYILKALQPKWSLFLVIILGSLYFSVINGSFKFSFGFSNFMAKIGPWGPWVFCVPIPLGALYYYFVRSRHEKIEDEK